MKNCTDIEQSKKLAEILPIESADMRYAPFGDTHPWFLDDHLLEKGATPCWSLTALIELMGECRMERTPLDQSGVFTHSFVDDYFNIRTYEEYDIVDAAVEMILKLHEKKTIVVMDYKEKVIALLNSQELSKEQKEKLEAIFPELKDEDEFIRKEIIDFLELPHHQFAGKRDHKKWIAWLEKQKEPEDKGEISDGYHTFNELYRYRMLYNAAFFNMLPKEMVHKSKRHHDGEECFGGGWFIVMANLPTGQISNHYELKDWDLFQIPEKYIADEWDGHTPQEAADRLFKFLSENRE